MTDSARLLQTLQLAFTLAPVGPCVSRGRVVDLSATSKQIGRAIAISPRAVEAHRTRLMKKFGAATSGELVARLIGAG